jgi:hypothetical protein
LPRWPMNWRGSPRATISRLSLNILDMARLEADQISKRWVGEKPPVAADSD